ncbi:MAG: PD40 domain-containing protein, partial [Planctomycetes bacterium]|nr:PD40 domain-containing protein [Planctomycetota bacterium]
MPARTNRRSPAVLARLGAALAALLCASPHARADDPLDEDGPALPAGAVLLGPRGLDFPGAVGPWALFDDGRKIALNNGRRIRVFDTATRKEVRSWVAGRRFCTDLAASPDGRRLASVDAYNYLVHIWDPDTGKQLKEFNPHRGYATGSLSFSADGKYVATVGSERGPNDNGLGARWDDFGVRVRSAETGAEHPRFVGGLPGAHGPAFSADGKWFAWVNGGGADSVSVRPLAGGDDVGFNVGAEGDRPFAFSPDGKSIAVQVKGGGLFVGETATGKEVRRFKPEDELPRGYDLHQSVRFAPDNRTVLTVRKFYRGTLSTNVVRVRDVVDGTSRVFATDAPVENGLVFSKDGKSALTLREDRNLQSWDLATGKETPLPGHVGAVVGVAITPDGRTAATAGRGGTVRVWTAADGAERHVLKLAGAAAGVAFLDAGRKLVSADATGEVRVWDAATGKALRRFAAHKGGVTALAVSPDGATLATGGADSAVRLWSTADGTKVQELAGHKGWVLGVWFAGKGKQLLSTSGGGIWTAPGRAPDGDPHFRLWDLATGRQVPGAAQVRATTGVALAPDGTRAVSHISEGNDGRIQEWDLATGRKLADI